MGRLACASTLSASSYSFKIMETLALSPGPLRMSLPNCRCIDCILNWRWGHSWA